MGLKLQARVWDTQLTPSPLKFVLLAYADRANDLTGEAWPSLADTAARCGLSPKQARRHVHALVKAGYLVEVGRQGSGVVRYRVGGELLAPSRQGEVPTPAEGSPAPSLLGEYPPAVGGSAPLPSTGGAPSHPGESNPTEPHTEPKVKCGDSVVGGGGTRSETALAGGSALASPLGVKAPDGISPDAWVKVAQRKARPFTSADLAALADQVSSALAGGESSSDVAARLLSLLTPERSHWKALPRAEAPAARATPGRTYERPVKARKSPAAIARAVDRNYDNEDYS